MSRSSSTKPDNRRLDIFQTTVVKAKTAHVILAAETEDFDSHVTQQWTNEGFNVYYVPLLQGGNDFITRVRKVADGFGVGEQYALVAFGAAASLALEAHKRPSSPRLIALIAYYPSSIPSIHTKFPSSHEVLVHLAGNEIDVRYVPTMLGLQGNKTKMTRKRIDRGIGLGQRLNLGFPAYTYSGVEAGFAERDLEEYDRVAAEIAWSRSLRTVRRGFKIDFVMHEERLEGMKDEFVRATQAGDIDKATALVHDDAQVLFTPTMTGGIGKADLDEFYRDFFSASNQSATTTANHRNNLSTRLLSRTTGTDRVVDELLVKLTHREEIHWLLPGVPPTNKSIEIVLVSIFHVQGERLVSEHVYWDQASVLVQAGLLDPKVAGVGKMKGKTLPIYGNESARAVSTASSKVVNDLIPDW